MSAEFLFERFAQNAGHEALVWQGRTFDYRSLLARIDDWDQQLDRWGVQGPRVVIQEADYSPGAVALMLALIRRQCVVVPLTPGGHSVEECAAIVGAEYRLRTDVGTDRFAIEALSHTPAHSLYDQLRREQHAALILFSSGSTGPPKAAVHDVERLLHKFQARRRSLRTLAFLMFDHIGGVDTLLYSLSNVSCLVTVPDRLPETVCASVEKHQVEVLPVSPSFLNLLILSQAYERYDLSSLKVITYGAEVMPEATLRRCHELFPNVQMVQKFGATEVGALRSKSKAPDSTWVRIGGEGYQTRIVDGILHIKAHSAILGYLNAPSPFTADGWFVTGDLVEVDGEYMRILGRESDVINVGGEKVNPSEVENVIHDIPAVREVAVYGERNAILGNIVCASVSLVTDAASADHRAIIRDIKERCRQLLPGYKVPVKIAIVAEPLHSERSKKLRRSVPSGSPDAGR
jgi:acyl-CoA synthetase (AMP-forming)/AMP-acid ligase II